MLFVSVKLLQVAINSSGGKTYHSAELTFLLEFLSIRRVVRSGS